MESEQEYKLTKTKTELNDYLKYIQHEHSLLRLNQERRTNDYKIKNTILQRIKVLYNEATQTFPSEKRLWDDFFVFMTTSDLKADNSDVPVILDNMLIHHGDHIDIWLKYIKWEGAKKNEKKVKNLLMSAIQRHPESEDLHIEFIDVELSNHRNLPVQNVLDNIILIYNNARKQISSLSFLAAVLDRLNKFSFSKPLQLIVFDDMKSMYCNKELFWHILAQRELNGLPTFDELRNKQLEEIASQSQWQKVNIQRCVKVYEGALSKINSTEMWTFYLNAMIELNDDITTCPSLKRTVLASAFKAAYDAKQMSETHCVQYIDIMYTTGATDSDILNILESMLALHPTSSILWECLMKYFIQCNDDRKVEEIFEKARTKLGDESLPIWHLYMKYLFTLKTTVRCNKMNELFLRVMKEPSEKFRTIKVNSIECTSVQSGMHKARQLFNFAIKNGFPCLEIYNKMAEMEELQVEPDVDSWRNCLELAIQNYGEDNIDVWLNLIKFELRHGNSKNTSKIAERARHRLKPHLVDTFMFTRDAFQQGIVVP